MEQKVTCTSVNQGFDHLDQTVTPLNELIADMTSDDWEIVSTESASNAADTYVLIFWRRGSLRT